MNQQAKGYILSAILYIIAAIVFLTISWVFEEPIFFYMHIPFSLSIFFFSILLLHPNTDDYEIKLSISQFAKYFPYILAISSIIIVLLVPTYEGTMFCLLYTSPSPRDRS